MDYFKKIDVENLGKSMSMLKNLANANVTPNTLEAVSKMNSVINELNSKGFESENIEKLNDELKSVCDELKRDNSI